VDGGSAEPSGRYGAGHPSPAPAVRRRPPAILAAAVIVAALLSGFPFPPDVAAITPSFDTPNIRVDNTPAVVDSPRIAVGGGGLLHVAWRDFRNGNADVYYARSTDDGATWTPAVRIDDNPWPTDTYEFDLGANASGTEVYVVYTDARNGDPDVFARRSLNDGVTWSPGLRVDDAPAGVEALRPSIAVDDVGSVHLAWEDFRNVTWSYQIYHSRSRTEGASWSANVQVSDTTPGRVIQSPAATAVGDGEIHVAWRETGSGAEAARSGNSFDGGATWIQGIVVSECCGQVFPPDIVARSPGGPLYATWTYEARTDVLAGHRWAQFARSLDGGVTWSGPVRPDDIQLSFWAVPESPTVALAAGDPYVVWSDDRFGDRGIYASGSSDDGATWGDCPCPPGSFNNDALVDDAAPWTIQQHPASAATSSALYSVWEDFRNSVDGDIYFARNRISKVQITEFRDSSDGTAEVVEIANFGGKAIDLTGYSLRVDGASYPLSPLGSVPPMSYRTIGNWAGADLRPPAIPPFSLGDPLLNHGGTIQILDAAGTLVDEVRYGQRGVAPDPLTSVSTQRSFDGTSYVDQWAMDLTPTLGARNDGGGVSAAPPLILNEVLYAASSPPSRFLELYYTGTGSLDTTGYRLVGNTVYTIPAASGQTLTPANRLGMVSSADGPGAATLFNSLLAAGDNLYLYDPAWNLLDEVGWSSTHAADTSVCRRPDGAGTHDGFDDASTVAAGWRFGCAPGPPSIELTPSPQVRWGDFGETLRFTLTATNRQTMPDYLDLTTAGGPNGWTVALYDATDTAPLADSPLDGDGVPDTGLLGPGASAGITVRVTIPGSVLLTESESVNVTATASPPLVSQTANLVASLNPYLTVSKTLSPAAVNVLGTGFGEVATLTLEVRGRGVPIPREIPADVVLLVDSSWSMDTNDGIKLRLRASSNLLDWMADPAKRRIGDRVAVAEFATGCSLQGPDHHLDSVGHDGVPNYDDPKADLAAIILNKLDGTPPGPGHTDLLCPLVLAEQEFLSRGNPVRRENETWIAIMLTEALGGEGLDGQIDDVLSDPAQVRAQAAQMGAEGIIVYTVGITTGPTPPDEALLRDIAEATNGRYIVGNTVAYDFNDLIYLLENVTNHVDGVAALDPWTPSTPVPMIQEVLPAYIEVDPLSYRVGPGNTVEMDPFPDCTPQPACGSGGTLPWNVSSIAAGETWSVSFDVRCTQEGTLPVEIVPDSQVNYRRPWYLPSATPLLTLPFPAQDIACIVLPAEVPRDVTTTWDGATGIGLSWEVPSPVPDHYLVYRVAGSPRGFSDLSRSSGLIVARPPGTATSWADLAGFSGPGEYFYVMRSSNAAETDLSATSNTAGVHIGTLNAGLTAISRPLEYFPWVDYTAPGLDDTLSEYAARFGAARIDFLDAAGRWQRGAGETLSVGDAYVVTRGTPGLFVFTGLPGSHIRYDDASAFAGFDPAMDARSLEATVAGDDVLLAFDQPPGMVGGTYEVWYSPTRTGFFDGTATLLSAVSAPGTPTVTVSHVDALLLGGESYYMVIPVNAAAQTGASSYSVGVWTKLLAAHDTLALPLRPDVPRAVSWYADAIPGALGILWLTTDGVWVPHFTAMEAGVYDAPVALGSGVQVSVRSAAPVRYAFVGS